MELIKGDCLAEMDRLIERGVKVDMILTDPPYGTTACKWDSIIPFEPMWERINKLIKPNGAIVLFGSEPFSSALRMSNIKNYKYDWVWDKGKGSNPLLSKKRPMGSYENIMVFYKKQPTYIPQMRKGSPYKAPRTGGTHTNSIIGNNKDQGAFRQKDNPIGEYYPLSVLAYSIHCGSKLHPTQKPVALLEYLIKTYTNEGETVLDFTMGSGSTGVACKNTGRNFIGIELDEDYYNIAENRINGNN